jgi:hypothetical protein
LHTFNACITWFSSTFLCFGNIVDWHASVCSMLEVTEYFIRELPKWAYSKWLNADWLMRVHDSRCTDVSKTQPPLFVSVSIVIYEAQFPELYNMQRITYIFKLNLFLTYWLVNFVHQQKVALRKQNILFYHRNKRHFQENKYPKF